MRAVVLLLTVTACGRFGFDGDDEPPLEPPAHVPDSVPLGGVGDLMLPSGVLDTTALTFDGAPPMRGQFVAVQQTGGGPELAMLQADHVTIVGDVRVVGARGLVIVARTIEIPGSLDASAQGTTSGPGAATSRAGPGAHLAGDVCDSGGGGGGHATSGATGGDATCGSTGGAGAPASGTPALAILVGGGAGGNAVSGACGTPPGGGGGGAIQLSAGGHVSIAGAVRAGGGGGSGGPECGDGDAGAGGGGGAGGAIYIESRQVRIDGLVIAHGGGGGAGGNGLAQNGPIGIGGVGADGTTLAAAAGGVPPAPNGGTGGSGGTGTEAPGAGQSAMHNAGGGGGAAGRIGIDALELHGGGTVSPAAN